MERLLCKEFFSMRLAGYALAIGGVFQAIVLLSKTRSWSEVALEGGFVEVFQTALIAMCAIGFLNLALRSAFVRPVCAILLALSLLAVVREFNNAAWHSQILPESWMKWALGIAVVSGIAACFRTSLWRAAKAMAFRPSATLFVLGFAIVVLWAQTLAQDPLWTTQDDRLLEECLELAGYLLIFFGVLEAHFETRTFAESSSAIPSRLASYGRREGSRDTDNAHNEVSD